MTSSLVITGVDGFVGRHLARVAAEAGANVIGISRARAAETGLRDVLSGYISADLRASWPAPAPSDAAVVHLAGLAAVGPSFDRPQDYIGGNSAMVTNMCEARLAAGSSARIVIVSTGAVYATKDGDSKRTEDDPITFTSPYVVSKILVENQAAYYRRRGLDTVVARPFNHVGPGQALGFLVPDLVSRVRSLEPGEPLTVGDLSTRRDYTDVRDVARAYMNLACAPGLDQNVYNIASGAARSGAEILQLICGSLSVPVPALEIDRTRLRPDDPTSIVGDSTRLRDSTGWKPAIPLEQTIHDVVSIKQPR